MMAKHGFDLAVVFLANIVLVATAAAVVEGKFSGHISTYKHKQFKLTNDRCQTLIVYSQPPPYQARGLN
jgi:hypothetical protein